MIDYATFNKLYESAAESTDETTFILKTGWQSWMNSFKDTAIEFLKETYRLAQGGMSAIVESYPMLKNCAEEFQIPYKTVQKWATGGASPAEYLIKMMSYTIALKATIKEETKMDIKEKIVDAIIDTAERAMNGNIGNYYSAYINNNGKIYFDEETDFHSMPEAVYTGRDRSICSIQSAELWGSDEEKYDAYVSYLNDEQKIQLAKDNYDYEARAGIEYIETKFPEIAEESERALKAEILAELRNRIESGISEYEDTINDIIEWLE